MERTVGFVIKCRDYSETSQIIWLYTKDFGKISLIAKGSRASIKKFKSKLDLFNLCEIVFYKSRKGGLHTMSECDVIGQFEKIRNDLHRLAVSSYMAELADSFSGADDPCEDVFHLMDYVFRRMDEGCDPEFLKCVFEIKLMQFTGHMPRIESEKDLSAGAKAVFKRIVHSKAVDKLKISQAQVKELRDFLRLFIDYYIGKRLKSLEFLESFIYGSKSK